jgi:protein SCO1/2
MNGMKVVSVAALAVVGAITVGGAVLVNGMGPREAAVTSRPSDNGISFGGPFSMTDVATGKTFTQANLQGKPTVMFFGYTYCPDVCPTTLSDISTLLEEMGADADKLSVVFISIDPERDTADKMKKYLSYFDKRIVGLVGTDQELATMAKAYGVYYERVPGKDGSTYTMNHTATVYLLDSKGDFKGTIDYQENQKTALAKLENLARSG